MYPNFIVDRKALGSEVLKDTRCEMKLVLIMDSTVPRLLTPSKSKWQAGYVFIRKLPSKVNGKSKRVIVVIALIVTFWFSNVQPSEAIGLPMPPTPVVKVQPSYQDDSKVKIAKLIPRKTDLIIYKSPKEIVFLMYLTDPRLSSN